MNFKRDFIWVLPLLLIVTGPLWWSTAADILKPRGNFDRSTPSAIEQLKSFVMEDVLLTQSRGGRDEFFLKAARVNSGLQADVLELETIEVQLLRGDGQAIRISGGEGFYHTSQQIITVIDKVRVQTPEGQEMHTEALRYLLKYRKVKTAEAFRLKDQRALISGGNLTYDLLSGNFRVGGGVKVDLL